MSEWYWIGGVFGSVFVVFCVLFVWVAWRRQRDLERLRAAAAMQGDSSPDMLLGDASPILADTLPLQGDKATEISQDLLRAGMYQSTAIVDYAAVRFVLIVVPLILAGFFAMIVEERLIMSVAFGGIVLSGLGFSLPRIYINYRAKLRRDEISRALPVAVDLLALGLLSGQNIIQALRRVSEEIRHSFPILAEELLLVRHQADMNTLPHALAQFADRVDLPEVRTLSIILSQSQRQGTDTASALMEYVNNFRLQMRQEADRRANQASFWLVFPSIFFLWVPAFGLLVAPVVFEMTNKGKQVKEQGDANAEKAAAKAKARNPGRTPSVNGAGSSLSE